MKVVRLVLIMVVVLSAAMSVNAQKKNEKTVIFNANLHCESCKAKVEKNIPYEKGVKDLKVDMKTQTITVTFREDKNTTENLQKAIEKLNIEVKGIEESNTSAKTQAGEFAVKKQQHFSCCGSVCKRRHAAVSGKRGENEIKIKKKGQTF